jgi:PD-(D/E)XK nuclease superfamily
MESTSDTLGGSAAQTGQIVHAGVSGFHQNSNDPEAGLLHLEQARPKFPGGVWKTALEIFNAYIADPENQVVVPYVEFPVKVLFAPLSDDPLGLPIEMNGTTDQIRRHSDGELYIWDIKTGSRLKAKQYLYHHMYQLSAYAVAATQTLGKQVHPGGLICTDGYSTGDRVMIHCPWYYSTCLAMMASVVRQVTEIRKGNISINPSEDNCKYCPLRSIDNCIPKHKAITHVR